VKTHKIIIEEDNVNLFAWYTTWSAWRDKRIKDFCGDYLKESFMEFKNDYGRYGPNIDNWNNLGKLILENIKNRKISYVYLKENSLRIGKEILKSCDEILAKNLDSLNKEELINNLKKIWKLYYELIFFGIIPVFSDFYHLSLTNELKKIIKTKKDKYNLKRNEQEYISILVTPIWESIVRNENIELLKITSLVKQKDGINSEINERIKNHTKKYCWINYGYQGPAYDENYFINAVKETVDEFENPDDEIKKLQNAQKELKEKQELFLKELNFNGDEKYIFDTAREFLFLKAYRVEIRHKAHYVMDILLNELGKRLGLTLEELRYTRIQDFDDIAKLNKKELRERRKYCVCYNSFDFFWSI
jgi:hypothetical protein